MDLDVHLNTKLTTVLDIILLVTPTQGLSSQQPLKAAPLLHHPNILHSNITIRLAPSSVVPSLHVRTAIQDPRYASAHSAAPALYRLRRRYE